MRKLIVISLFVLTLLSVTSLVSAAENARSVTSIHIEKGWNLIQGTVPADRIKAGDISADNIKVSYTFIAQTQQYVRLYPEAEEEKIRAMGDVDDYIEYQPTWIYSDKAGTLNYELTGAMQISQIPMYKGWNFVSITSDMVGSNINDLVGSCKVERAYYWNANVRGESAWSSILETNSRIDKENVGYGFLVKVSSDCRLGTSIAPPPLPPPTTPNKETTPINDESPFFPKTIGTYRLNNSRDEGQSGYEECNDNICVRSRRAEYRDTTSNKVVFVMISSMSKGNLTALKESFAKSNGGTLQTIMIGNNKLYRLEKHELFWFTSVNSSAFIFTQEGTITFQSDGYSFNYENQATGDNAVTKYYLSNYPSVEVN